MSFAELLTEMAQGFAESLAEKRLGKKRVRSATLGPTDSPAAGATHSAAPKPSTSGAGSEKSEHDWIDQLFENRLRSKTPTEKRVAKISRHIPRAIKYQVWQRARGKCSGCGSHRDLQFDHLKHSVLGP